LRVFHNFEKVIQFEKVELCRAVHYFPAKNWEHPTALLGHLTLHDNHILSCRSCHISSFLIISIFSSFLVEQQQETTQFRCVFLVRTKAQDVSIPHHFQQQSGMDLLLFVNTLQNEEITPNELIRKKSHRFKDSKCYRNGSFDFLSSCHNITFVAVMSTYIFVYGTFFPSKY